MTFLRKTSVAMFGSPSERLKPDCNADGGPDRSMGLFGSNGEAQGLLSTKSGCHAIEI
jgi:hypothetical protein